MTDEEIWALNRGGHDPRKVYAAYHAAMQHEGQPTVILAKTIKGYGMGARRRGPEHHPPAEEDERGGAAGLPRPLRHPAHRRADARGGSFYQPPDDSPEMSYLRERREALGGCLPARARRSRRRSRCPRCRSSTRCSRARASATISTTMAFVRVLSTLLRDKAIGPPRGADRARRGAHLRHGGHVPPARHLLPGGPALPTRGRRAAHVLPRGQEGPDPPGGHQRGRRALVVDRRRHLATPTTACR